MLHLSGCPAALWNPHAYDKDILWLQVVTDYAVSYTKDCNVWIHSCVCSTKCLHDNHILHALFIICCLSYQEQHSIYFQAAPYDFLQADDDLSQEQLDSARAQMSMWTSEGCYPLLPYSSVVLEAVPAEQSSKKKPLSAVNARQLPNSWCWLHAIRDTVSLISPCWRVAHCFNDTQATCLGTAANCLRFVHSVSTYSVCP